MVHFKLTVSKKKLEYWYAEFKTTKLCSTKYDVFPSACLLPICRLKTNSRWTKYAPNFIAGAGHNIRKVTLLHFKCLKGSICFLKRFSCRNVQQSFCTNHKRHSGDENQRRKANNGQKIAWLYQNTILKISHHFPTCRQSRRLRHQYTMRTSTWSK